MNRFLISCWSFPGHIRPSLALAGSLRERGHEVALLTGPRGQAAVADRGFRCFPFMALDENALYKRMFSKIESFASVQHPLRFLSTLRYWLLETIPFQVRDLVRALDAWNPDVLITDVTFWASFLIVSAAREIPVAVLSFAPGCMIPHKNLPPWGLGIEPPRGGLKKLPYRCLVFLHTRTAESFRRAANRYRSAYGLPPIPMPVNAYAGTMPLYLIPSARELDDPRDDLPPSVHYVGPLAEQRPGKSGRLPGWFEHLDPRYPKVHVTEGTLSYQEPVLLKAAIEGFAHRPFEVILTTGREMSPGLLSSAGLPSNIHIETFIPHELLLPMIDCLVTTGGAGTVLASLAHGVPMVIAPTEWDKPDNARHVKNAGAGIVISHRRCNGTSLRRAVEHVISDSTFREHAVRMASVFTRYRGAVHAAELLEHLCSSRKIPEININ